MHDKETRSYNMSRIKGVNTKPEILVRKHLHQKGFRFRLHAKQLPGRPDIVLKKYNTVIFIHGCFWHGHTNCRYYVIPKTRTKWWSTKIETNKLRDKKKARLLRALGWNIITIWECELKSNTQKSTLHLLEKKLIRLSH